jgi:hypothetical protein
VRLCASVLLLCWEAGQELVGETSLFLGIDLPPFFIDRERRRLEGRYRWSDEGASPEGAVTEERRP